MASLLGRFSGIHPRPPKLSQLNHDTSEDDDLDDFSLAEEMLHPAYSIKSPIASSSSSSISTSSANPYIPTYDPSTSVLPAPFSSSSSSTHRSTHDQRQRTTSAHRFVDSSQGKTATPSREEEEELELSGLGVTARGQISGLTTRFTECRKDLHSLEERVMAVEQFPDEFKRIVQDAVGDIAQPGGRDDKKTALVLQELSTQMTEFQTTAEGLREELDEAKVDKETMRRLEEELGRYKAQNAAVERLGQRVEELEREKKEDEEKKERERLVKEAERLQEKTDMEKRLGDALRAVETLRKTCEGLQQAVLLTGAVKLVNDAESTSDADDDTMVASYVGNTAEIDTPQKDLPSNVSSLKTKQRARIASRVTGEPITIDSSQLLPAAASLASSGAAAITQAPIQTQSIPLDSLLSANMEQYINDTGEYTEATEPHGDVGPDEAADGLVEDLEDQAISDGDGPEETFFDVDDGMANDGADDTVIATNDGFADETHGAANNNQQAFTSAQAAASGIPESQYDTDTSHARLVTPTDTPQMDSGPSHTQSHHSSSPEPLNVNSRPKRTRSTSTAATQTPVPVSKKRRYSRPASNTPADFAARREKSRKPFPATPTSSQKTKKASATPKKAKVLLRKSTGPIARMNIRTLRMSKGIARGQGKWPPRCEYTIEGKANEIVCEVCKGKCHYFCAGIADGEAPPEGDWNCPDCLQKVDSGIPAGTISLAPQEYCIRGNCLLRAKTKTVRKKGDENVYYPERIVGHQAVSRNPEDKSRNFIYLVKWHDWDIDYSTWEPTENMPHQDHMVKDFREELQRQNISKSSRICLLPEAAAVFDADTGELIDGTDVEDNNEKEDDDQLEEEQNQ